MPRQPVAQKLIAGETLRAGEAAARVDPIQTVPIEPEPAPELTPESRPESRG